MARVAGSDKKVLLKALEGFPSFLKNKESDLVTLLEAYYRWVGEDGNVQNDIYRYMDNIFSNSADDDFKRVLVKEFARNIPDIITVDESILIEHILDLYRTKGTIEGVKLFFRLLYGNEPSIFLPKDVLLRSSDGIWVKPTYVLINYTGDDCSDLEGKRIYGSQSNAFCMVESCIQYVIGNETVTQETVTQLTVSGVRGEFTPDEIVSTKETDVVYLGRVYNTVVDYTIVSGGTGFSIGDTLATTQNSEDGFGFEAQVSDIDEDGGIVSVRIINPGIQITDVPPTFNSGGAEVIFQVGTVRFSPGFYSSEQGLVSSSSAILQDGGIYQDYSYVVRTDIPFSEYKRPLYNTVHVSGVRVSGEYLINTGPDDFVYGSILFHLSQTGDPATSELNYKWPSHPSSSRFVEPRLLAYPLTESALDKLKRLGYDGDGGRDRVTNIEYFLDLQIDDYLFYESIAEAYIKLETIIWHDVFTDAKTIAIYGPSGAPVGDSIDYHIYASWVYRYTPDFEPQYVQALPETEQVGYFYNQQIGSWQWVSDPARRVYSHIIEIDQPYIVLENGDLLITENGEIITLEI